MSYSNFPTLPSGQVPDSRKFNEELIDNTLRKEMDAGYTVSRPRTTRPIRKVWNVVYTMLPDADYQVIKSFNVTANGNAAIFMWVNPQDQQTYYVRFKGNVKGTYVGRGTAMYWDCTFTLEQA